MLEAGISFKEMQKAVKFQTSKIKGCLITHEHNDHAKFTSQYLTHGIECFATSGTVEGISVVHHRLHEIEYKKDFKIGTWTIKAFKVNHDAKEPCGYLLKSAHGYKLLFVTDTYYCQYKFPGITHMMLEVNYIYEEMQQNVQNGLLHPGLARRIMKSHFSLEHAIGFLRANDTSQLKAVHLIHLSKNNSNATIIKEKIQEVAGVPVYVEG
ncbi:MBL fold metallo-hydrolase [Macrococcus capreoli]|uniref:MBL fold metallo-hydrolase n=1 Tax=Macrococcus capreoli TaxID=2982690 RepID=UPI003F41E601